MKSVFAILLGVASAAVWETELTASDMLNMDTLDAFRGWQAEYGRNYASVVEEADKYLTWLDNLNTIAHHNSYLGTYKMSLNQFSDMTGDEFRFYVHGKDGRCFKPEDIEINLGITDTLEESSVAATSVAWQNKGVVTPVKNQGQCGSCWAFSATGAIECDYAIKTGTLNSLSEQQLVDCAGATYGCQGCNGGQMTGAMRYAANDGGLCLESAYKYTARNGQCKSSTCGTKYDKNTGYKGVTKDSESAFVTATNAGCISIGIEADQTGFQHYSSGVFSGTCGTRIDHGVLITGYGTSGNQDYWWVKNSWGTTWGERGYMQMCRNCNKNGGKGECGILTEGNVPTF